MMRPARGIRAITHEARRAAVAIAVALEVAVCAGLELPPDEVVGGRGPRSATLDLEPRTLVRTVLFCQSCPIHLGYHQPPMLAMALTRIWET
jgi:hypothetical protein